MISSIPRLETSRLPRRAVPVSDFLDAALVTILHLRASRSAIDRLMDRRSIDPRAYGIAANQDGGKRKRTMAAERYVGVAK